MIDQELIEQFVRSKILLQERLSEIGSKPGSAEIESQMIFLETRMKAKLKQDIYHGIEEMAGLRYILNNIAKPDKEI